MGGSPWVHEQLFFIVGLQNILLSSIGNKCLVVSLLKNAFSTPENYVAHQRREEQLNSFNFTP